MDTATHMLRTGRRGALFEVNMALRDVRASLQRIGLAWSLAKHDVVSRYRGWQRHMQRGTIRRMRWRASSSTTPSRSWRKTPNIATLVIDLSRTAAAKSTRPCGRTHSL